MKKLQILSAAFFLALPTLAAAAPPPQSLGPGGGPGGSTFQTNCEQGDSIVGFDLHATHVITKIAPVCGKKNPPPATVGTPFVGTDVAGATVHTPRCEPGSILTILHVFIDKTPLVSAVGFTCFNRLTGQSNDVLPIGSTDTKVNEFHFECSNQRFGTGIFGRVGTAIDALGLRCTSVD